MSRHIFPQEYRSRMAGTGVIAVLVIDDPESGAAVASVLLSGGISIIELALRTPASLDALSLILKEVPEMLVGVGTVLRPDQVAEVKRRGAAFIVTPGTNRKVIESALKQRIPIAPGVTIPSDIETALEYDLRLLKFFPAEPQGGIRYLKAMNAPYAHLGIEYIPLGGVSETNCGDYLNERAVIAVGGSWIAPRNLIKTRNWEAIKANAARAVATCTSAIQRRK